MPAPDLPALTLTTHPIWARVPAGSATIPVLVELTASDLPLERARPNLALTLVIDVSGSMAGPPIEQVIRSVERILGLLQEHDEVGVVAFSTRATTVAAQAKLDVSGKRAIVSRLARVFADGRTNIEGGLALAARQFPQLLVPNTKRAVVLLSDGEPNEGASSREALAEVARTLRPTASISTLGYGARHDEAILMAIAEGGGGCYRFISDPAVCQLEIAQAVGAQGDIAVEGIELVLAPAPGVQIGRLMGAGDPRFSSQGMLVTIPDLPARSSRSFVVELDARLDAGMLSGRLLSVKARYKQAGFADIHTCEALASVDIGGDTLAPSPVAFAKALLVRTDSIRAEARALADRGQFEGAAAVLRRLMTEIENAPGYAKADGSALSEAWEQLLDEAMAMERRPGQEALVTLKASTGMKSFAAPDGIRASSRPLGRHTRSFSNTLGGTLQNAWLVIRGGPDVGARFPLGQQNTIGRTPTADVFLKSAQVSRRHADVFALEGDFFIADLGSTNITAVNGARLTNTPHLLKNGDQIRVGDVQLVFERPLQ